MREIPQPSFAERSTLHLGGHALVELVPENASDLERLSELAQKYGAPLFPLGRGSNVLAVDGEIPLVLVRPGAFLTGICIANDEAKPETGGVLLNVGAGASMARVLRFCAANGLSGLEGMVGIPGSLGGAIAMNAGSFGSVIGAHIHSITVLEAGFHKKYMAAELEFSYRHMAIKGKPSLPLILSASLSLTRAYKNEILGAMRLNFYTKKSKQPLASWSAGCAFKNISEELPAGRLLEEAGMRGRRLGGMAFSSKHANFLVNEGNGTASEALELMDLARSVVRRRTGYELQPEIRIVT